MRRKKDGVEDALEVARLKRLYRLSCGVRRILRTAGISQAIARQFE